MRKFDFLIVGAGLFGSTFAFEMNRRGYSCIVVDRRNHIGGNCYTKKEQGIDVHTYGAHIFHTDNDEVWEWVNQFGEFNGFINQPLARIGNDIYNLPFNMNLFSKVFDEPNPNKVRMIIEREKAELRDVEPKNLEEQAIKLVGRTIYKMFIKGYTEKQWGLECSKLPPEIIKRIPVRFVYDNNYFNDKYQGIPKEGYTKLFERMLEGVPVLLETDYKEISRLIEARETIYTGMIDEFFNFKYGNLEYRSLDFVNSVVKCENYQGNAVVNYPLLADKHTRIIEHKHFNPENKSEVSVISKEIPTSYNYKKNANPYYPIDNEKNRKLYLKYLYSLKHNQNVSFCGRLGEYRYNDMDDTILNALKKADKLDRSMGQKRTKIKPNY